MKLEMLLQHIEPVQLHGSVEVEVLGLTLDSRQVEKGFLYAALPGTQVDGHDFIDASITAGAQVILCSTLPEAQIEGVSYVMVSNVSENLGRLASTFYGNPSSELEVVAITGTNGKTTCTSLLYDLFTNLGHTCGLLSTVEVKVGKKVYQATHTTPNAIAVQGYLKKMVDAGCDYCFMEASSHAIDQNRLSGLAIEVAGFTNLSHDHLDYHKTFAEYRDAKKKLFDSLPSTSYSLTNKDDKNGSVMLQNSKSRQVLLFRK